jgi:hypothetical protein
MSMELSILVLALLTAADCSNGLQTANDIFVNGDRENEGQNPHGSGVCPVSQPCSGFENCPCAKNWWEAIQYVFKQAIKQRTQYPRPASDIFFEILLPTLVMTCILPCILPHLLSCLPVFQDIVQLWNGRILNRKRCEVLAEDGKRCTCYTRDILFSRYVCEEHLVCHYPHVRWCGEEAKA